MILSLLGHPLAPTSVPNTLSLWERCHRSAVTERESMILFLRRESIQRSAGERPRLPGAPRGQRGKYFQTEIPESILYFPLWNPPNAAAVEG